MDLRRKTYVLTLKHLFYFFLKTHSLILNKKELTFFNQIFLVTYGFVLDLRWLQIRDIWLSEEKSYIWL